MAALDPTPRHRDLVYDVGLHTAEDTEFYLKKGFRVVAFEANPDLARGARERFREAIEQGRLTIVEGAIVDPAAIAAGRTTVTFARNDQNSAWGTLCDDWVERNARYGTTVTTLTVDAVDFREALKEFQNRPAYLSLESDKTRYSRIRREVETLAALGYDSFQAVEQSRLYQHQRPPEPAREGTFVPHAFPQGSSGLFGKELGGAWLSKGRILRLYRAIRAGYYFLGDAGVLNRLPGRPGWFVRGVTRKCVWFFTRASVPGWYDTHARHSTAQEG